MHNNHNKSNKISILKKLSTKKNNALHEVNFATKFKLLLGFDFTLACVIRGPIE